jgi:hypothetical protein
MPAKEDVRNKGSVTLFKKLARSDSHFGYKDVHPDHVAAAIRACTSRRRVVPNGVRNSRRAAPGAGSDATGFDR